MVKSVTEASADVSIQAPGHESTHGRIILRLNAPEVPLTLQVFNPGGTSIFPVSSTLIIGQTEVALVDAQFQKTDAEDLVKLIKSSGRKLTLVYISHEDPDYYFGCEVIQRAFPECPFYAIKNTIDKIESTKDSMLNFWSPTLGERAPQRIIVPQLLKNHSFTVNGYKVEIKEPIPDKSFCWVPSMKAVLGGFPVFGNNVHLWLADDQTTESRTDWYNTLISINNLYPDIVVPSHFYPGVTFDVHNIEFTEQYLSEVERHLPLVNNSAEFVKIMENLYTKLQCKSNLEISAKVLKGELEWPHSRWLKVLVLNLICVKTGSGINILEDNGWFTAPFEISNVTDTSVHIITAAIIASIQFVGFFFHSVQRIWWWNSYLSTKGGK